jgi:hypothetical protein
MRLEQLNSTLRVQAREDKEFIISAVTSESYNIIRFKYGSWLEQNGSAAAYLLIIEIVDNIMFSNDSLYLRTLVKTNGFEQMGWHEATDTNCLDWYFMIECSKELENRLKGWSYLDMDIGLMDSNVSNANDMILGLLGDLKEGDRNVIFEEINKKFGSKETIKKIELRYDLVRVINMGTRDVQSYKLVVKHLEHEIAYGHINNRTNTAHITIADGVGDRYVDLNGNPTNEDYLESYLVENIENRRIKIEF